MIQFQSSFNMIKFVLIPFKEIILVANIQSCIFLKILSLDLLNTSLYQAVKGTFF